MVIPLNNSRIFLPASGGNLAERLLHNRGRARAFIASYAHSQLRKTYSLFVEGRWMPPVPERTSKTIISLTSWVPRFNDLPLVLLTLIQQTTKPQEIVLWLTESDRNLLDNGVEKLFKPHGVRIAICDDLKSHKKWLPMIESGHAEPFVICDDDIIYPREWLARLLVEDRKDAFVGLRAHQMIVNRRREIGPYASWKKQISATGEPSPFVFVTGGAGAIIDPERIKDCFLKRATILSKCPTADDIWLNMIHISSGIYPYKTRYSFPCLEIPGTAKCGLAAANVEGGDNDRQMTNIDEWFHRVLTAFE